MSPEGGLRHSPSLLAACSCGGSAISLLMNRCSFPCLIGLQSVASSYSIQMCCDHDPNENDNTCLWTSCWDLPSICQATSRLYRHWSISIPDQLRQSVGWSLWTFQWGVWSAYPPLDLQFWSSSVPFHPLSCRASSCLSLFLGFSFRASNAFSVFMYLVAQ